MKSILKFFTKLLSNFWVRFFALVACIIAVFALGGVFEVGAVTGDKIIAILTSADVVSFLVVALFSLIVADAVLHIRKVMEESLKIDDDHHKIICKYSKHKKLDKAVDHTYMDKDGVFMYLESVPQKRKLPSNPINDKYSSEYKKRAELANAYADGKLYLPSVNVFANVDGDVTVVLDDVNGKTYELPTFVTENALALMEAHGTSTVSNSDTIRLDNYTYSDGKLTLNTSRSQYYDMLVTNRCMDFELGGAVTIRKVYEAKEAVTPLEKSQLGNQIGINGLIISKDGYLLIEKRGRNKTTWKNKFAQPISLALKLSDVATDADGKMSSTPEAAEQIFKKVILKTIKKNFGIDESDIGAFSLSNNFMGIARDLLEGGKPNMYFYVVVDKNASELCDMLERKAKTFAAVGAYDCDKKDRAKADGIGSLPTLTKDKLDSSFYLVNYKDIVVDYEYVLKLNAKKCIRVKRKFAPCVGKLTACFDGLGYKIKRAFGGKITRECGEALLACLYYASICPRITGIVDKNEARCENAG